MAKKFIRRNWTRHSKLGKGRKKKITWRRPKGRHNKIRERRKGYPARLDVGYRTDKKSRKKKYVLVKNINDLSRIHKHEIVIVGNVGKKKMVEIVKKAHELKVELHNVNIKKFMKEIK
jgi:large subunit ribosomal protein L32e